MTSSDPNGGSLENTAQAVSMVRWNTIEDNRGIWFRFVIEVVNVFLYVSIMKMPTKLKRYSNVSPRNRMVD